jgi:hypothetical protein
VFTLVIKMLAGWRVGIDVRTVFGGGWGTLQTKAEAGVSVLMREQENQRTEH